MIYSNSFIKIFFIDVRDLQDLEHSLLSLLRFLFISRLLFCIDSVFELLCFLFIFMLKWESLCTFRCPKAESFSRFAIATMLLPLWHARSSIDILSLISTTLLLLCPLCHICSVPCLANPSTHALAILTSLPLSSLFLQGSPMAICIGNRLWFPNTSVLHLLYLIFSGCKLLYGSEMLLAVLSKSPFFKL